MKEGGKPGDVAGATACGVHVTLSKGQRQGRRVG